MKMTHFSCKQVHKKLQARKKLNLNIIRITQYAESAFNILFRSIKHHLNVRYNLQFFCFPFFHIVPTYKPSKLFPLFVFTKKCLDVKISCSAGIFGMLTSYWFQLTIKQIYHHVVLGKVNEVGLGAEAGKKLNFLPLHLTHTPLLASLLLPRKLFHISPSFL